MKVSENPLCSGCPMAQLFPDNPFVPPKHGTGTRLVVGEAPGADEAILGEPFVGAAGSVFNSLYSKAGLSRLNLTIVNTINCRPPDNVFPDAVEAKAYIAKEDADRAIKQCVHNHVKPVLESKAWTRVDLLGGKALKYIAGLDGIYRWRGSIIEIDTEKL